MRNDASRSQPERVTATGWRIVGQAANDLAERLILAPPLQPSDDGSAVYAARCTVKPLLGSASALPFVLGALSDSIARLVEGLPPLDRERPRSIAAGRFEGLRWDVSGSAGAFTGELLWRHPHPVKAGIACTTHVIVTEQQQQVAVAVRVETDQPADRARGSVEAGQLQPPFLRALYGTTRLTFDGGPAGPVGVSEADTETFVSTMLFSEARRLPVAVLAPLETGGYAVPPEELAAEFLGLAHLRVITTHAGTFRLTDSLGDRRLSAYFGALRVYMPGFSCADDPSGHPLLQREQLTDPVLRASLLGRLGRHAVRVTPWPHGVLTAPAAPAPRPAPSPAVTASGTSVPAPRAATPPTVAVSAPSTAATLDPTTANATGTSPDTNMALIERLDALLTSQRVIADEIEQMRTTMAVRSAGTSAIERRLASLEQLLTAHLTMNAPSDAQTAPAAAIEEPPEGETEAGGASLVEVLRQAAARYPDALLVLETAESSAIESPFEDPERVGIILDAMAHIARRRQDGVLGTSLREAFRDVGVDYRGGISGTTPRRLRDQHRVRGPHGLDYECEEHIALGNSYDPRHCLRIYFSSRAQLETRFVIGHVGRHFEVQTTT